MGAEAVDMRVEDGVIAEIATGVAAGPGVAIEDGNGQLLVPGFLDAPARLDKTFWGLPWRPHQAGP